MESEIKPLKKLNEAIMILKEAGYEFKQNTITDTKSSIFGKYFYKRVIKISCFKNLSLQNSKEANEIDDLISFSNG